VSTKPRSDLRSEIRSLCRSDAFQGEVVSLLERLCAIDTTTSRDLAAVREGERQTFAIIEDELKKIGLPGSQTERRGIPPSIQDHPAYTIPSYARRAGSPLPAHEVYEGRYNLLYLVDRPSRPDGLCTAVNAHVDVVSPFIDPRRSGEYLCGRGTADDKGNIAGALGALKVLATLEERGVVSLKNKLTAMFVIDEEIGGNGSLALAADRALRARYDSLMVLECTSNLIYPANRGAVYVKAEATLDARSAAEVSLAEVFCHAILALKAEADSIRSESHHPFFPERPVYMCPGILGPYGAHPSSICAEVELLLESVSPHQSPEGLLAAIDEGLAAYIADFGDKTRERDPRTGEPRVRRHFDVLRRTEDSFLVSVHGTTGHLGAFPQNDPAIFKWAYIVRALVDRRTRGDLPFRLSLPGSPADRLVFEGAQGFIPTHAIEAVMGRVRSAFLRGVSSYLDRVKAPSSAVSCEITFDKLHNNAYTTDERSPSLQRALKAARESGTQGDGGLVGWNASCDARLFAEEYPSLPVITCGAGELGSAHSAEENIYLPQLFQMVEFMALFLLRETGSVVR
jgi:acetylornithine deacetylase/succinyl-diaminopimelate desuccinylase-like protein